MSTRQKVLLCLALVLVIVLFVVAVGGGSPGQGSARGHNRFVSWLAGLGGGAADLPPELVSGDCVKPDHTLTVAGSCALQVADPGKLKMLVLRSATPFHVVAPALGKADYTAESDVSVEDGLAQTKVALDKAGTVEVGCVGATTCTLTIGEK